MLRRLLPAALLLAAACGSPIALTPGAQTLAAAPAPSSWMATEAKRENLLYVSDQTTNSVYVYSYPSDRLVGTLTGFYTPNGECVDARGDVWIGQFDQLAEYAHGGTTRLRTLHESGGVALSCAVDPTTGDLAVSAQCNYDVCQSGAGYVAIYRKAQGRPRYYTAPNIVTYFFCAYDAAGDLFVDGENYYYEDFELDELPHGSRSFEGVILGQPIAVPGDLAWDGHHLTVEDEEAGAIYRFSASGSGGVLRAKRGTTLLTGASALEQYWIYDGVVIGANYGDHDAVAWRYPRGGAPVKTYFGIEGSRRPFGVVVSRAR